MVFSEQSQTTDQTQAEQQVQEAPPQDSYLQKLVETKGENWKDPEVLAKGKLEADGYIKNLEAQLEEMREDLKKSQYQKEVFEQLQSKATDSTTVNSEVSQDKSSINSQNTTAPINEEDLKSLVEQTLTQREQESIIKRNLAQVDAELEKSFGTEAKAEIEKKAFELGMSLERMRDIAAESPSAFFALIGEPKKTFSPITQGSVRTEGVSMQTSTERDWSYYQKLRRENRNMYYSAKTQQQMFEDKARLGDKFGA